MCRIDLGASSVPVFAKRGSERGLRVRFNNSTRLLNAEEVLSTMSEHFDS